MTSVLRYFPILLISMACLLSACGGSGSVTAPKVQPLPDPLKVNAGANTTINENQTLNLLGGSSGGQGAPTFSWTVSDGAQITHADTSVTNAVFTAPTVTQISTYTVTLTATDASGSQQSDTINITVNPVNLLPSAIIQANQIEDYGVNEFPMASTIVLDGSSSSDADPQTNAATIAAYRWQQIAGPNLLAGVNSTQASISLVVPVLNENQTAVFRLTVSDQEQASASADYTAVLLSQQQTNINVKATPVRSVFSGELTVLEATATSIAPDAAPFSAIWQQMPATTTLPNVSPSASAQIQDATAFITAATTPLVSVNTPINYQVNVSDSFRNSASAQVEGQVFAPITRVINDTGVVLFANENELSVFHSANFPGQDASYGADRQMASGTITKMGEGAQGFDFTRLDAQGKPSDNANITFACARDNVTGLIWQVKDNQDVTSLSYVEQTFTWYQEDDSGNFAGALNTASTSCNVPSQACNTQAYINAINTQGLCGAFDWRLPSLNELQSVVHYGNAQPPFIDATFFPHVGSTSDQALWYWTMQSSAEGVANDIARNAWAYDLNTGSDGFIDKTIRHRVMLVRAGR